MADKKAIIVTFHLKAEDESRGMATQRKRDIVRNSKHLGVSQGAVIRLAIDEYFGYDATPKP